MFRIRDEQAKLPDSVSEAGVADGFIHVCQQSALMFGSDRQTPASTRPVVKIKQHGPRFVVLPCTTRANTGSMDFFALNENERVIWVNPEKSGTTSMAYYRYEVISPQAFYKRKIGFMPQAARIELLHWLKSRYLT